MLLLFLAASISALQTSVMIVDCAAVETGCMLEKYIPGKGCNKIRVHFLFFGRGGGAAAAATAACC